MKLHTLLATLVLPFFAATAQAALVHDTQTKTYAGTAGNTSTQQGVGPLMFSLFDLNKGPLQGVYLSYGVTISGGVSGADNQTNQAVNGTMELGGSAQFESTRRFFSNTFQSLFSPVSGSKVANFSLAADPSLAIGGNGPDVFSMAGDTFTGGLEKTQVNSLFHSDFTGFGQFAVDFRTFSILQINAPGSRGFFDAPNVNLSMSLTYVYDAPDIIDPPADVSSPFLPLAGGLALLGLGAGAFRRKHKKNILPTNQSTIR